MLSTEADEPEFTFLGAEANRLKRNAAMSLAAMTPVTGFILLCTVVIRKFGLAGGRHAPDAVSFAMVSAAAASVLLWRLFADGRSLHTLHQMENHSTGIVLPIFYALLALTGIPSSIFVLLNLGFKLT